MRGEFYLGHFFISNYLPDMGFLFRCLIIFSLATLEAWPKSEPNGKVMEKVICAADESQSYALYLPSTYTTGKKWPVIFLFRCFRSCGLVPVERLRVAAEKYGYIIAGSLTSRNGPWAANATAARAMIRDVSVHFIIDPQQVYTAGVSGGARVATGLAISGLAKGCDCVQRRISNTGRHSQTGDFCFLRHRWD